MSHLLVVEDDPDVREALQDTLETYLHGEQVTAVGTATAALRVLDSDRVDLIITDLQLPDKGGMELLAEAVTIQPAAASIILTAWGWRSLQELRGHRVLQKPFGTHVFLAEVRAALAEASVEMVQPREKVIPVRRAESEAMLV